MLNRRGFIAALAAFASSMKNLFLPAAAVSRPPCEGSPSLTDIAAQREGTNTIDQIISIGGYRARVNHPNYFQAGQLIDIHGSDEGMPYRGSLIVTRVDLREIHLNGAALPSVGVGDLLVVYGAYHQPNPFDVPYYQVQDAGMYMGIKRKA